MSLSGILDQALTDMEAESLIKTAIVQVKLMDMRVKEALRISAEKSPGSSLALSKQSHKALKLEWLRLR